MKKFFTSILCITAIVAVAASCGNSKKSKAAAGEAEQASTDSSEFVQEPQNQEEAINILATLPEEPIFDIITNMGTIKIKLYSKTPKHRENFAKLALSGYYDGVLFHRVIDGFMIQGGDPLTKDTLNVNIYGEGGPGYQVPAEFIPEYTHKKGALAAARVGDIANPYKESSGSQFYIVQDEAGCAHLNGSYTVYGETIEGLDVIDSIAKVETLPNDRPVNDVRIIAVKLDEKYNNLSE